MGYGGGPVARNLLAEDACRLRLRDLTRGEPLRPGAHYSGQLSWSRGGERIAGVCYTLRTNADGGTLGLVYDVTVRATRERIAKDYLIPLVVTEQPSGGLRYWFWCERARKMATVLFMMPGSTVFASRKSFRRVSYRSQRLSDKDRHLEKAQAIRMALGGSPNLFEPFPERPARMWERTYLRKRTEAEASSAASLAFLTRHLDRIQSRRRGGDAA